MRLLAVCIGVDKQSDLDVPVLPFAGVDAAALWALAADWAEAEGGAAFAEEDCVLLRGEDATRANILRALDQAVERSARADYDLVLVHFAGHGDQAGYLLGYDATAGDPTTGVSLADFADRAHHIQARHGVIALDACFSGRASLFMRTEGPADGAAPHGARPVDVARALHEMADERRAVLWACGAEERAWESARLGHGLLSYGLIRALESPDHLVRGRELSLMSWLQQALRVVAQEAATDGRAQTPGQHVLWNGVTALPRPSLGRRRSAQLAEHEILAVTGAIQDLEVYGFSQPVLEAISSRLGGAALSRMQQRAIAPGGLLAGHSVVVAAPTSTGKTLIGELAALGAAANGRRAMFLLPTRALVEEKYEEFAGTFGPAGVRAVRSYGGVDDDDAALVALQFDVAFLTYEKCLALCLQRDHVLDALGVVILDEVHLLGERSRGQSVEMLLGLLRARRRMGQHVQVVALSAALGDLGGLHDWLGAALVPPDPRPVPLRSGVVDPTGRFRFRNDADGTATLGEESMFDPRDLDLRPFGGNGRAREAIALAIARARLPDPTAQLLVFRAKKPDTRTMANALARRCGLTACGDAVAGLTPEGHARDESRASAQLRECVESGVAFHFADLDREERQVVERSIRSGDIRVTVSTATLASGVNTPATDVIMVDHMRYDSDIGRDAPYPVSEVRNTMGRAGRWLAGIPGGRGYLIADSRAEADTLFEKYFVAEPEPLCSQLGALPRPDLVLALLGARLADSYETLIDAVLDTLDGHQHSGDTAWRQEQRTAIREAVGRLCAEGFLTESQADDGTLRLAPTALGSVCAREGLRVQSAIRVRQGASRILAAGERLDDIALLVLTQLTDELERLYTSLKSTEFGRWGGHLSRLLPDRPAMLGELRDDDDRRHGCRLKRLFALLRWTQGRPVGEIEAQFGEAFAADWTFAGMIRGIAERTNHVLRSVAAILALDHPELEPALRTAALSLRPRLELGVAQAGADLARAKLGLSRAEIRALAEDGCVRTEQLADRLRRTPDAMAAIVGSSRAGAIRQRIERDGAEAIARRMRREDAVQRDLFADLVPIDVL
jgi:replicative superfamily II helicase